MLAFRRLALCLALVVAAHAPSLFAGTPAVPLSLGKSFNPSTVLLGVPSSTTMTVTITNPNAFTITGIAFSDTYPAGLVPDVVGAYTCGPGSASFNGSGFAFSGVTLAAGQSCSVPMIMHANQVGQITNTTSSVTGTGIPTGTPASAILTVLGTSIPAMSGWMLAALAMTIAAVATIRMRG